MLHEMAGVCVASVAVIVDGGEARVHGAIIEDDHLVNGKDSKRSGDTGWRADPLLSSDTAMKRLDGVHGDCLEGTYSAMTLVGTATETVHSLPPRG